MYDPEALKGDIEKCDLDIKMFEGILKKETELHFSTEDEKILEKTGKNMEIFSDAVMKERQNKEKLIQLLSEV